MAFSQLVDGLHTLYHTNKLLYVAFASAFGSLEFALELGKLLDLILVLLRSMLFDLFLHACLQHQFILWFLDKFKEDQLRRLASLPFERR